MLVHLLAPDRDSPGTFGEMIWSYPKYQVFRDHQRAFVSTAAFYTWNWNLTGAGAPERVTGELVDATLLFHARARTADRPDLFGGRNPDARLRRARHSRPRLLDYAVWRGCVGHRTHGGVEWHATHHRGCDAAGLSGAHGSKRFVGTGDDAVRCRSRREMEPLVPRGRASQGRRVGRTGAAGGPRARRRGQQGNRRAGRNVGGHVGRDRCSAQR